MVSLPSFCLFYYFFAGLTSDLFMFSVSVNSIIAAGDLELPSRDEEGETHVELPAAEVTPSGRKNKRKKTAPVYESTAQPDTSGKVFESSELS